MIWRKIEDHRPYSGIPEFRVDLFTDFIIENNIISSCSGPSKGKLESFIRSGRLNEEFDLPYTIYPKYYDHGAFFKNKNNEVAMIYHPYDYGYDRKITDAEWCKNNGLDIIIYDSPYSWYYPNKTHLVVVTLPETKNNFGVYSCCFRRKEHE